MIFRPMALKNSRGPTLPLLPPLLSPFVVFVEKDDVDIGAEVELAAAKFAHADNDEAIGFLGSRLIERAVILFHFGTGKTVCGIKRCFRQGGQFAHSLFHGHRRHQIARADAQVLALLVAAQGGAEVGEGSGLLDRRLKLT